MEFLSDMFQNKKARESSKLGINFVC